MGKCRSEKGQAHLYTSHREKGVEILACGKDYISRRALRLGRFALPRVAPSSAARLSADVPDVDGTPQLDGLGLPGALRLGALLLVVDWMRTGGGRWPRRAAVRLQPIRSLTGLWREAGTLPLCTFGASAFWGLLLPVCSGTCEESLKPCATELCCHHASNPIPVAGYNQFSEKEAVSDIRQS